MKRLSFAAPALLLIAGAFSTLGASGASAFPVMQQIGTAPDSGVVNVLCRYGSPHCVNPNPGPGLPTVNTTRLPDSGWVDPDCKYYGNCNTGDPGSWGDPSMSRRSGGRPAAGGAGRLLGTWRR